MKINENKIINNLIFKYIELNLMKLEDYFK